MARLTRDLLELAEGDYDDVLAIRKLHLADNQEPFHDFRKRIRSVGRMPGYFPKIMDPDDDVTEQLAVLTDAVDRYGEINDLITRYAADPDGDLADQIAGDWKALREWQATIELDEVVDDIHDAVRK
jgi:hypothetical protein